MRSGRKWIATCCCAVLVAFPALASAGNSGPNKAYGARVGFGLNPDQFAMGVQAVMGKFGKVARFAPSVDFGFGDNVTVISFNGDVHLNLFSPPKSTTSFYLGGGPSVAIIDPKYGDGDTELGLTLLGGLKLPMGSKNSYNIEARFGIGDIPDFRVMFGIFFGGRTATSDK